MLATSKKNFPGLIDIQFNRSRNIFENFYFLFGFKVVFIGVKKNLLCRRQRLKLLSAVCDSIKKNFAMSATALESTKWRFSNLNHKNFKFFGLVPKSSHTGLICVKTPEPNISCLWPLTIYVEKEKRL